MKFFQDVLNFIFPKLKFHMLNLVLGHVHIFHVPMPVDFIFGGYGRLAINLNLNINLSIED